jgi:hypothetical protein
MIDDNQIGFHIGDEVLYYDPHYVYFGGGGILCRVMDLEVTDSQGVYYRIMDADPAPPVPPGIHLVDSEHLLPIPPIHSNTTLPTLQKGKDVTAL